MSLDRVSDTPGVVIATYVLVESLPMLLGDLPLLASGPLQQQAVPKNRV